jgi:hypothetical protein
MAKIDVNVDDEKYRKSVRVGTVQRTYISYKAGTEGFDAVATLRARGKNVEAMVEDFLTQLIAKK